jgi:hypothetical protein
VSKSGLDSTDFFFCMQLHPNPGRVIEELRLLGLHGETYPEILDRIICQWMIEHADDLRAWGIELCDKSKALATKQPARLRRKVLR